MVDSGVGLIRVELSGKYSNMTGTSKAMKQAINRSVQLFKRTSRRQDRREDMWMKMTGDYYTFLDLRSVVCTKDASKFRAELYKLLHSFVYGHLP